jgi:hypothetical protein
MTGLGERQNQMLFGIHPIPSSQMPRGLSQIQISFPMPFFDLRRDPSGEADTELEQASDEHGGL